jgi:hypothetical protein
MCKKDDHCFIGEIIKFQLGNNDKNIVMLKGNKLIALCPWEFV